MRVVVVGLVGVAAFAGLILFGQLRDDFEERCTERWQGATLIDVSWLRLAPEDIGKVSPTVRRVTIEDHSFAVDASINKTMGWASAPVNPFHRQRIGVVFAIAAQDESTLRTLVPLCLRATLGNDTWERRARSRASYTRSITGAAVGGAGAIHGPEWPREATVRLALLASVDGKRYVLEAAAVPVIGTD
jgi:hypothetical protein